MDCAIANIQVNSVIFKMVKDFKSDEGRAWVVLVAAFLAEGLTADGIMVGENFHS